MTIKGRPEWDGSFVSIEESGTPEESGTALAKKRHAYKSSRGEGLPAKVVH
jgi:hypothetical protein